jgi:hypothetical protein
MQELLAIPFCMVSATPALAGAQRTGFSHCALKKKVKAVHFVALTEYHFARLQLKQMADVTQPSDLGFREAMEGLDPSEGLTDPLYVAGISPIRSR